MTIFKTYLKIVKKNSGVLILYLSILLIFTMVGTTNNNSTNTFQAEKPNVMIVNDDTDSKVVDNLEKYMKKNANIVKLKQEKNALKDALFYKDVNAIVYIYDGYTEDYLYNREKKIKVEFGNDYNASYVKMLLNRYFKVADIANDYHKDIDQVLSIINKTLSKNKKIEVKSKIATKELDQLAYYFNFANYSILALSIYIIAMIMNTFYNELIKKRNMVSSKKISTLTKELFLSNLLFVWILWGVIILLGFIIHKEILVTENGLFMILNSFLFIVCVSSIGFFIGSIVKSKEAINGIVNVVSLGSSFLCGCFVPSKYLPTYVVSFSKILPSYWYISNNTFLKGIETFTLKSLSNLMIGWLVLLVFTIVFFLVTLSYHKMKQEK